MPRIVAERADALPGLAEVFREHGFDGASLSLISVATGLGKGSLYHFFPGGKTEMLEAVLADIDGWFEREIFTPLTVATAPAAAIDAMFAAVTAYFNAGQRTCLLGALAASAAREPFGEAIAAYFRRWISALHDAIERGGLPPDAAQTLAEEVVAGIQGAIIVSRALNDPQAFHRIIDELRVRVTRPMKKAGSARRFGWFGR